MAGASVERPPTEGSRPKFFRGDARREPASLNVSQDVDRVSLVETDSESGSRGSGMIFVYLQAFTARRRERNSWHEVCNVQKETDSRFPVAEDCTVRDGWQPGEMVHRRR